MTNTPTYTQVTKITELLEKLSEAANSIAAQLSELNKTLRSITTADECRLEFDNRFWQQAATPNMGDFTDEALKVNIKIK